MQSTAYLKCRPGSDLPCSGNAAYAWAAHVLAVVEYHDCFFRYFFFIDALVYVDLC